MDIAFEKGRQERLRITDELKYQRAKSGSHSPRAKQLARELAEAQIKILQAIRAEKEKGPRGRLRIRELRSELRGLFWGKQ